MHHTRKYDYYILWTEEVLLTYQAHWWSEDGARLAYLTINNSATPFMEIPHFLGEVYPSPLFYAYPKVSKKALVNVANVIFNVFLFYTFLVSSVIFQANFALMFVQLMHEPGWC